MEALDLQLRKLHASIEALVAHRKGNYVIATLSESALLSPPAEQRINMFEQIYAFDSSLVRKLVAVL